MRITLLNGLQEGRLCQSPEVKTHVSKGQNLEHKPCMQAMTAINKAQNNCTLHLVETLLFVY